MNGGQVTFTLRAARAFGPNVTAPALVSTDPFSPRYDLDRTTGLVTRSGHAIQGCSIAGVVLVCPTAKGGVAGGWAFFDLRARNLAPSALLLDIANPVMVQGAAAAGIPIMDGFEARVTDRIRTGDLLLVDPSSQTITVHPRHLTCRG